MGGEEFLECSGLGCGEFFEDAGGEYHGVSRVAGKNGLADVVGILCGEFGELYEGFEAELRLVAESYGEMSDARFPSIPLSSASDGTEHAARGVGIGHAMLGGEMEAVQFGGDGLVVGGADEGELVCVGYAGPLAKQV